MAGRYVVTAPLVISKRQDGSDLYLYEGAELPDHAPDGEINRLVGLGLVEKVDASAKPKKPTSESN